MLFVSLSVCMKTSVRDHSCSLVSCESPYKYCWRLLAMIASCSSSCIFVPELVPKLNLRCTSIHFLCIIWVCVLFLNLSLGGHKFATLVEFELMMVGPLGYSNYSLSFLNFEFELWTQIKSAHMAICTPIVFESNKDLVF